MSKKNISRRRLLRGVFQGSAVSVGLPMLDLFLNDSGTAFANGEKLPVCFGSWFWGLGLCPGMWEPKTTGPNYELPPQLQILEPIKNKFNLYSGQDVYLDGQRYLAHSSTAHCIMTGHISNSMKITARSLDDIIAEQLGVHTRFPAITVSCDGNPGNSYSARGKNARNPAETSPLALYQRIFGTGFQDPNRADFTPDPEVVLRKSILSYTSDDRQQLLKVAGSTDRQRLDEFFTSLRSLEEKLALELQKPAPLPACQVPTAPEGETPSLEVDEMLNTHEQFTDLITHALACGQTRIFNSALSINVIKPGDPMNNHAYTHRETADPDLGYQVMCYWFSQKYLQAFKYLVEKLDSVREGDGTLLDRSLVLAYTEHGYAKYHSLKYFPFFTAGGAGGGIKNGIHVAGIGDPVTRVGFTCQRALGLPVEKWGQLSNEVSEPYSEVLA